MVTKRFPIQLLFRIKHWLGQYVITMDIMRVDFPSLVQAYSRYTAIKLLLFLPLPLAIKQGGNKPVPVTFPINFPTKCISVIAVLQAPDDSNMSKNRMYVVNISNTGFSIQNPQNTYMYIAIGI